MAKSSRNPPADLPAERGDGSQSHRLPIGEEVQMDKSVPTATLIILWMLRSGVAHQKIITLATIVILLIDCYKYIVWLVSH